MDRNTFRKTSRKLYDSDIGNIAEMKDQAATLEDIIRRKVPGGRYQALAMTALEEAVMWAVKGITE